tara:strand:- start:849 stop:1157 length:309 start_codon:yes stop_codon:yes gene_type:complete
MSGRGKGPVTSSRDEGTATSSVPAGSGSHADAVAQGMTVEDLQKELDRLKAYLKKVEAERDGFRADNTLMWGKWRRERSKRKNVEKKYHDAKQERNAKDGAK